MLRLVMIYQLVLSLIVGPMLCCCASARLAHGLPAHDRLTAVGERGQLRSCCQPRKSLDGQAPSDTRPSEPTKCPFRGAPAHYCTAPEIAAGSSATSSLLDDANVKVGLPLPVMRTLNAGCTAPHFTSRSSSLSTLDLLYAHHNLRC